MNPSFLLGFRALLPLWLGMAPFAAAYAVTARAAGLSLWETQLLSLGVFAGAAQFAAAGLFGAHAGPLSIIATTAILNARHLLYGLSLSRLIPLHGWRRLLAAQFLTDEAYGVTLAHGHRQPAQFNFAFLLGTELSLYLVWNVFTLLGSLFSGLVPDPAALGVDLIFPLAFLGLLVPLLRPTGRADRAAVLTALLSGAVAWALSRALPGGVVVLLVGVAGALLGAWLHTRRAEASA